MEGTLIPERFFLYVTSCHVSVYDICVWGLHNNTPRDTSLKGVEDPLKRSKLLLNAVSCSCSLKVYLTFNDFRWLLETSHWVRFFAILRSSVIKSIGGFRILMKTSFLLRVLCSFDLQIPSLLFLHPLVLEQYFFFE